MKVAIIFGLIALISIVSVESSPLSGGIEDIEQPGKDYGHYRVKRVTCDVLSVEAKGVKLNHSICALHCLTKGRSGGYCNGRRICVCR